MDALLGYGDDSSEEEGNEVAAQEVVVQEAPAPATVVPPPSVKCELCDEAHNASSRCVECEQYMCEVMVRAHEKSKATSKHCIQSLAEAQEPVSARKEDAMGQQEVVQEEDDVEAEEEESTTQEQEKKKKKKKKSRGKKPVVLLPSASSLLANMPTSLLGLAENVIDSDEETQAVVDRPGTKYHQVAPPSNLGGVSDEEAFRLKPAMSLELQREAQAKQLARINKKYDKQQAKSEKSAENKGSSLQFAPRQLKGRPNPSTEDLEGMGLKKHKAA